MSVIFPMEVVVTQKTTHILFDYAMPRRIYTDGRDFPKSFEPSFYGYSIGKWVDEDGDGRYDVLEVESRGFKGPRSYEATGIPLHADNETVVKERFFIDKTDPNTLHDEITVSDHALTRPWTSDRQYRRIAERVEQWPENWCQEGNANIVIGKENYFLRADGLLMPAKRNQAPPDLRNFTKAPQ